MLVKFSDICLRSLKFWSHEIQNSHVHNSSIVAFGDNGSAEGYEFVNIIRKDDSLNWYTKSFSNTFKLIISFALVQVQGLIEANFELLSYLSINQQSLIQFKDSQYLIFEPFGRSNESLPWR